jgi:hypothetical protein
MFPQRDGLAPADPEIRRPAEDLDHPAHGIGLVTLFALARDRLDLDGRGDGGLGDEGTGHADHAGHRLRPVDQHFLFGRLVLGDRAQRDVGDDAADFLAALVLAAPVDEAAGRPAAGIAQLVVGEGGGEEPLARQGQGDAAGVDGDIAACPRSGSTCSSRSGRDASKVYRRRGDGWVLEEAAAGETLRLTSIDVDLRVDEVYRDPLAARGASD